MSKLRDQILGNTFTQKLARNICPRNHDNFLDPVRKFRPRFSLQRNEGNGHYGASWEGRDATGNLPRLKGIPGRFREDLAAVRYRGSRRALKREANGVPFAPPGMSGSPLNPRVRSPFAPFVRLFIRIATEPRSGQHFRSRISRIKKRTVFI